MREGVGNFGGGEIHEGKERNHQKGVNSALLISSLLGKHTYRVIEYQLGLKHFLLARRVGFQRFFIVRNSTPLKTSKMGARFKNSYSTLGHKNNIAFYLYSSLILLLSCINCNISRSHVTN